LPLNIPSVQTSRGDLRLEHLPLVTLYLTERCNSRCITCDYWRHGRRDMSGDSVLRLLPSLRRMGTRVALISGGEPLLNPEWYDIALHLKEAGLGLWLLTSGLSLAKHATRIAEVFDAVTVSMDGTNKQTYAAIRGLDAFDKVCEGIRAAVNAGLKVGLRATLQRANYRELPRFVELAHDLEARYISFLAVDVANPHAFGRAAGFAADLALRSEDLPVLEQLIQDLAAERPDDFRNGFIAESPAKLLRLHQYFAAVCGRGPYPPVKCNAPELSAVLDVTGAVHPCFFISGPAATARRDEAGNEPDLESALNTDAMVSLRQSIRAGRRPECATCVCSLYREPGSAGSFLP
jgi:MoaA/NifB/PqqE/SkfB family radical SAM enzyme